MIKEGEFDGFRVEEVLSRSSTTTVYRAFQLSLKRPVLIKELRPELIQDKGVLERFEREAQVCARIKHENIVDIYDRSVQGDRIFLVMEFVQGSSLESLIASYSLVPPSLALAIILQTLRGLAYAHSQGVIHRDLKPGNILISRDGWVKITDFGLSTLEGSPVITQPGAVVGTPAYLAPEAISGGSVTPASDIFSLGVTFYQLLTGQKIFHAEHFSDSLKKVLSYHPPPLAQWRDDLPPELDRIILRMLEKQPSKRWAKADDILQALENQGLLVGLGDPKQVIRQHWEQPEENRKEATPTPSTRYIKSRRRNSLLRMGGIAVLALLAVVIFLLVRRQPEPVSGSSAAKASPEMTSADTLSRIASLRAPDTTQAIKTQQKAPISPPEKTAAPSVEEKTETKVPVIKEAPQPVPKPPVKKDEPPPPDLLADARPALLKVQCDPWADVYLDDILLDKTPFEAVQISPGKHQVAFRHPAFPPVFREVEAKPGQEIDLNVNFWGTVGRIYVLVDTWADVYIDGRKAGITPLQEPLVVPLGTHKIALINPSFPPWEKDVTFQRDDPPCTLKVELKAIHGLLPSREEQHPALPDSQRLGSNLGTVRGDSLPH